MAAHDRDDVFVNSNDFTAFVTNVLQESGSELSDGELQDTIVDNHNISDSSNDENSDSESEQNAPTLPSTFTWNAEPNNVSPINFTGNHGINPVIMRQLTANCTELDVLNYFCDDYFWTQICNETNKYASDSLGLGMGDNIRVSTWKNIAVDELKAYFALVILLAQNPKSDISDYWSTRRVKYMPIFGETMARDRFKTISRYLHFSSSINQSDKLRKLRPIIDYLLLTFKKVFTPEKHICIDESLMMFRGRLSWIQFNPSKRARFGIKIYKVCDSKTGYCYNFKIYTGKDNTVRPNQNFSVSEQVVLDLCSDLLEEGRVIFMDNWYSSPNLFRELLRKNTYAVGTVRSSRKNIPVDLKTQKLKKGELTFRSTQNMLCLKWKDRKDVAMLSTIHEQPDFVEVVSQRERSKPNPKSILKPNVVVDYNQSMCGVDKQDQRLSCFPVMRRTVKGYKKIFFYLFDIAIYNCLIVHNIISGKNQSISTFRVNLAEQILQNVQLPARSTAGRPSASGDSPLRLQGKFWGHFIEKYPRLPKLSLQESVKFVHLRVKEVKQYTSAKNVRFHFIWNLVLNCFTPKQTTKELKLDMIVYMYIAYLCKKDQLSSFNKNF